MLIYTLIFSTLYFIRNLIRIYQSRLMLICTYSILIHLNIYIYMQMCKITSDPRGLSIVHCFFFCFFFTIIKFYKKKTKKKPPYPIVTNNWKRKEKSQKSHGNSFIKRCKNTEGLRDTYSQK